MVYGGGGAFGIAYGLGVAHGLAETGLPVATAPARGTSAGSWVASAVALGLAFDAFDDVDAPSVPTRDRNALVDAARSVFGDARHPLVAASAVSLRSGRRHILDGGRYPLALFDDGTSEVTGLVTRHRVEGRV
jgi:predicted acylesterase/phospholipase RssA